MLEQATICDGRIVSTRPWPAVWKLLARDDLPFVPWQDGRSTVSQPRLPGWRTLDLTPTCRSDAPAERVGVGGARRALPKMMAEYFRNRRKMISHSRPGFWWAARRRMTSSVRLNLVVCCLAESIEEMNLRREGARGLEKC